MSTFTPATQIVGVPPVFLDNAAMVAENLLSTGSHRRDSGHGNARNGFERQMGHGNNEGEKRVFP
ncbi:hypothetical protein OIU84_005903, partial [Salix udensis]